ncbi:hypothetical protein BAOM_2964 [Peribacillus asahii]|uniref:Uncharacterized protein n=1 Tax=Peribacillus asahii TaxID=228899 RepID=A0A3T0KTH9_9BACI|nr:hypothetical protein [Peribacillus asahii]AZV43573.1 hypothetical protein BAOM_2964 [Peribacillus asahii]
MKEKTLRQQYPKLYAVWSVMKQRCNNKNSKPYKNYGERGIKVCEEWNNSFDSFCKWALDNDYVIGMTLDRTDNDGNYEPDNCRWITHAEQQMNKQAQAYATIDGVTKRVHEWCKEYNINYQTVNTRYWTYGWDWEKAIKTPVQSRSNPTGYKLKRKHLRDKSNA